MSASLITLFVYTAHAADGTWTLLSAGNAGGTWSDAGTGNWSGGTVADGGSFTARFDTLDITAASTVALGGPRTIGTLVFGDTATASAAGWTLSNGGTAGNILTLGGAATITVDAMSSVNNTGSNATISAVIDGVNGLTKNGTGANSTATNNTAGTGTLTLSGANTYTGATNIQTGTIRAANASAFGGVSGGKLLTNVVNVSNGARLMLSGVTIANTVNLNGANALAVVSGSSALSGTVNLQSNSTAYVHNGGNYTLTFSGTLNLGGNVLTLQTTGTNNGAIISGVLTGAGGVTKNGAGPLTMSADGTGYSGTTSLMSGELLLGTDTALGTGTLVIAPPNNGSATVRSATSDNRSVSVAISLPTTTNNGNSSGILRFGSATTGGLTFTNTADISMNTTPRTFDVLSRTQFDAGFTTTGSAGITKTGAATLVMNGASTYGGGTTVSAGTFQLGNGGTTGSLSSGSAISVASGAIFAVNRSNAAVQGTDFKTIISGAGGFTQAGSGTTTMAAGNTYTGATTISAGTLALGANNAFADTSNFVMGAGTFAVGTFSDAVGTLSLTGNATITLGAGGSLAFLDSHLLDWGSNQLSITGTFVDGVSIRFGTDGSGLTGAQLALISINGSEATLNGSGYLVASAIPEPSTYAMMAGSAFLGLALMRRRRDRA